MKIVDMMEKVFQMRKFKDRIKVINKSFPNFSDVVGKRGRILGVVIFIVNISFENVSYVFVEIVQWGATI